MHAAMSRRALALVGLAGCNLYFGSPHHRVQPDAAVRVIVDAFPIDDAPPVTCLAWDVCRDGIVYEAAASEHDGQCDPPDFTNAPAIATCQYGCSAFAETPFQPTGTSPCGQAPWMPNDCALAGNACTIGATQDCGGALDCGYVAESATCTCPSGTWSCVHACSDNLCSAEAVQEALVGVWSGTVTPPSFAGPYTVTLTIAEDGSWAGTTSESYRVVFYYGDNGGSPAERILVDDQTAIGAFATVGLFGNEGVEGFLANLHVDAHHLTFTFEDAWLGCSRHFAFDLTR